MSEETILKLARRHEFTAMSVHEAQSLFNAGKLDECLEAIFGCSDHASIALGIRCLVRQTNLEDAEKSANAYWDTIKSTGSDSQRGEMCSLRGMIAGRLGKVVTAIACFGDARCYLIGANSDRLQADLELSQALFALTEGDLGVAQHCAMQALSIGNVGQRATAREVLSIVRATNEDERTQLSLLEQNLAELAHAEDHDYLLAGTVRSIALLAQQQDRADLYETIRAFGERIQYTRWMQSLECDLFRELGVLASRCGDHLAAFRYLRRSTESAPSPLKRLAATLDGATVSREINESIGCADRVMQATEQASLIDWESTPSDQRVFLFALAEEQSRIDPKLARKTLHSASKLNRCRNAAGPLADSRIRALGAQANGIILKAEGNTSAALPLLAEAFEYWAKRSSGWNATILALEILEIGPNLRIMQYVERYLIKTRSVHLRRQYEQKVSRQLAVLS